ncbi:MAG: sigma-70 family RNA polymerase sigma factor [Eubacteriales bacterium]|nr:sigma-70 family RNA polymerase sigma factor [Eubacteriales bacterium]MDY3761208.1 sigma-70 family RNA polymerase sigma factor [Eubacteriales bacterium]
MLFTFAFGEDSERARAAVRDEDILAVARNGPDALRRLYEKTSKGVYAYALSLLKNAHDAEDVCQETFLSIYDKAGDYEPQGKPMAWIITVAKRHALTVLRKERGKSYIEEAEKANAEAFSRTENTEQRLLLQAATEVLNDDERQIVMLKAVAGMKAREIGKILGMPLNTVLSKYHRAIGKMRLYIEKEDGDE